MGKKLKVMSNVIKLHGKELYFKNIVGYGCSFMSGAESCDDTVRLDMDLDAVNQAKLINNGMDIAQFYKNYVRQEDIAAGLVNPLYLTDNAFDWKKLREYEKKNSWFNFLVKNFEGIHRNMSLPGGSFCDMQYKHMQDVTNNAINDEDLIIVGLTSSERVWYINNNREQCNAILGWPDIGWPKLSSGSVDEDFYKKYILHLGNHNNSLWDMLRSIYYFKNLKNPIIFVPQWTTNYFHDDFNYDPIIKRLMETFLESSELIPLTMSFPNTVDDFFYGPGNNLIPSTSNKMSGLHPSSQQQQQFANNIYNYLKC